MGTKTPTTKKAHARCPFCGGAASCKGYDDADIDNETGKFWAVKCLGVYVPDVAGYLATVIADKFKVPAGGSLTLDDLSDQPTLYRHYRTGKTEEGPSQVKQLIMTLAARIQAKRKAAGDTIHDMRKKAGVACYCRICCPPGRIVIERGDADESGAGEPVGVGAEAAEEPF